MSETNSEETKFRSGVRGSEGAEENSEETKFRSGERKILCQ
ncbi:MAG: hypothetical protein Q4C50_08995 [Eubacteriales bacterium]|nr:hypothetical protein [Eubacteriales bacterium]